MRSLMAIGLIGSVLVGCNAELDQYRRVELGKPLDKRGPLLATTLPSNGLKAVARLDVFVWPLPSIAASKSTGFLLDASGNVQAKFYTDDALEHWLVAQGGVCNWRMEVMVPPEYFHETPPEWKDLPESFGAFLEMQMAINNLSDGLPDGQRGSNGTSRNSMNEYVEVVDQAINPKRLKPGVLERITAANPTPSLDLQKDVDLMGLDAAKIVRAGAQFMLLREGDRVILRSQLRQPRDSHHLVAYIDEVHRLLGEALDAKSSAQDPSTMVAMLATNFPLAMFVGGRTTWPGSFHNHPEDFKGLTQAGFERTINFGDGGKARLRNLGGRRIEIEFTFARIIDPFFIIPMIECSGPGPGRKESAGVRGK